MRPDVTDVLLSHLHFTHRLVERRRPAVLPERWCGASATTPGPPPDFDGFYRVLWTMPTSERMGPVLAQFEPWDEDAAIAPGLDCVYAPGHTPGSAIFSITSGAERALILGDSVHCPQELMDPAFFGGGVDLAQADATRERIRHDAEDGATLLSAPHFPRLQFGRLRVGERRAGGLRVGPVAASAPRRSPLRSNTTRFRRVIAIATILPRSRRSPPPRRGRLPRRWTRRRRR